MSKANSRRAPGGREFPKGPRREGILSLRGPFGNSPKGTPEGKNFPEGRELVPLPGRKAEETRARIVAAAAKLFGAHGFDRTSTRAIAAEAGVAHGTLFRYAPTKEDLVEAVFADSDDAEPAPGHAS